MPDSESVISKGDGLTVFLGKNYMYRNLPEKVFWAFA